MIREGGVYTPTASRVDLLVNTQFSTITKPMMFVVRIVASSAGSTAGGTGRTSVRFRRGSIALSEIQLDNTAIVSGGIQGAEDAELFRGQVMPGNLYLEVSSNEATIGNTPDVEWDITAY